MKIKLVKQPQACLVYVEDMRDDLRAKGAIVFVDGFNVRSQESPEAGSSTIYLPGRMSCKDTRPAVIAFDSDEARDEWAEKCLRAVKAIPVFGAPRSSDQGWTVEL